MNSTLEATYRISDHEIVHEEGTSSSTGYETYWAPFFL